MRSQWGRLFLPRGYPPWDYDSLWKLGFLKGKDLVSQPPFFSGTKMLLVVLGKVDVSFGRDMFFSNKQGLNEDFGHWFKLANEYWSTDISYILYYLRWFGSYTSPWGFSAIRQCNFTRYNLCVWSGKNASRRAKRWRFWPNKFLITKKACTVDWFFGIKCPFCLGLIVELPLEKINHRLCLSDHLFGRGGKA